MHVTTRELTDAQLFDRAASTVSVPRRDAANSFVLHAPLELMARQMLLPFVPEHFRGAVRERIAGVAASYEQVGQPVEPPRRRTFPSIDAAREALLHSLAESDLDGVDSAAVSFLDLATVDEVMTLADPTIESLAAAGHAPIGLFLASRLATTNR